MAQLRVLVTGSAGHLGEALVRVLQSGGQSVVGMDVQSSPFTSMVGSIADRGFVRDCLRDVDAVLHTATLHKPHVGARSWQEFVDTNITGTLTLLEEAVAARVQRFVFTSTTSAFGQVLRPNPGEPAVWITEEAPSVAKNIYGATKTAAEDLCALARRDHRLPVVVLRTARFFPEPDDSGEVRDAYEDANVKVNEYLYRRVDIQDVADAHVLAMEQAPRIGFGKFVISATSPFVRDDLIELRADAPAVVARLFPDQVEEYERRGWRMFPEIDRVYVNDAARAKLGWRPRYDFRAVLDSLCSGGDWRSPLARAVGVKGYAGAEGYVGQDRV